MEGAAAVEDGVVIRFADTWNEDEIVELYRAGGWWKDDYDPHSIPDLFRGSFTVAIAVDQTTGHAIGMGRVLSDGISDGYIQDLVVHPAFRKKGIGTLIVTSLVERCKEAGISWICAVAEPGTESFYRPLGFNVMQGHIPLLWKSDP